MGSRLLAGATALGLVAFAVPAQAAGGTDEEWASLDSELDALARELANPVAPSDGFVRVNAVVRANYAFFEQTPVPLATGQYSGFAVDNARLTMEGDVGDTTMRIQVEGATGSVVLLDAYASMNVSEAFGVTVGQFMPPVLRSGMIDPENLLFILRTRPGQFFQDLRDQGVQLRVDLDMLNLAASVENGGDGASDELAYTLRADFDALGGGVPMVEGTYGSGRQACLTFGAAYRNDDSVATAFDGAVVGVDVSATVDRFSIYGEWLDFDDDGGAGTGIYGVLADTAPWSVTASFMFDTDKHELAVRYEEWDVANDISALTVGINRYVSGHKAKWVLNARQQDSDLASEETFSVGLGLTVSV